MVDDQIDARQEPAEVVRLHVDGRDPLERRDLVGRHDFDLNIEQVGHAQILGTRHALHGADDRGRPRAPQQVAQRETRGERVGVRLVVEQDQHAIRVLEVALVLLHARARQRSSQLRRERGREQLREIEMGDFRHDAAQVVMAPASRPPPGHVEHVDEAAPRVANGRDDALEAALAGVLDDDAGVGREVGAEVGIDPRRIGDGHRHAVVG